MLAGLKKFYHSGIRSSLPVWLHEMMTPQFRMIRKGLAPLIGGTRRPPASGHLFWPQEGLDLIALRSSKRLAVMAIHQPRVEGVTAVPRYLIEYVKALKSEGLTVVLINAVDESERWKNDPLGADLYLERQNAGLDFGSWCDFARLLQRSGMSFSRFDEVLLVNDSVIGPLMPLQAAFAEVRSRSEAVMGLTDCYLVDHHPQSFFLLFKSAALSSGFLDRVLSEAPYYFDKDLLIVEMEVGMGRKLKESGLGFGAVYEYLSLQIGELPPEDRAIWQADDAAYGYFTPKNPTHFFAEELRKRGFPFVKRELVAKNPLKLVQGRRLQTDPAIKRALELVSD